MTDPELGQHGRALGQAIVASSTPWATSSPRIDIDKVAEQVAEQVTESLVKVLKQQEHQQQRAVTAAVAGAVAARGPAGGDSGDSKKIVHEVELTLADFVQRLDRVMQEERQHVEGRLHLHEQMLKQTEQRLAMQLERLDRPMQPPQAQPLAPMETLRAGPQVGEVMGTVEASLQRLELALVKQQRQLDDVVALEASDRHHQPETSTWRGSQPPAQVEQTWAAVPRDSNKEQGVLSVSIEGVKTVQHNGDSSPGPPGDLDRSAEKTEDPATRSSAVSALDAPILDNAASPRSRSRSQVGTASEYDSENDPMSPKSDKMESRKSTKETAQDILAVEDDDGPKRRNSVMGMPLAELEGFRGGMKCTRRKAVFDFALQTAQWWDGLREPPRRGELAKVVHSVIFETICGLVIVANAGFMVYMTDLKMENEGREVQSPTAEICELVFLGWYLVELLLKMAVHRLFFFIGSDWSWNIFDFVLVIVALYFQLLGFLFSGGGGSGGSAVVLRALRVLKLVKVLRAVRLMRYLSFFNTVRLILVSVIRSWVGFFWCLVMVAFILYLFAIIYVQSLADALLKEGDSVDPAQKQEIMALFGSVSTCMLTLFKAAFGGKDWEYYYLVLERMDTTTSISFLFFICFVQISVLNIITALFIEMTLRLATPDTQTLARQKRFKEREEIRELRRLVAKLDPDNTGTISAWRFQELMENAHLRNCFAVLGLDFRNLEEFFDMLGFVSGDSTVDIETFVEGCARMRGEATGVVQQNLLMETKLVRRAQKELALILMEKMDDLSVRLVKQNATANGRDKLKLSSR